VRALAVGLGILLVAVPVSAGEPYDFRDTDAYRSLDPADRDRLEQVDKDLTTLWGALDRYADEHGGNPPDALPDLVPHFLLRLPRDPFARDGAAYGYRRGAPGNRAWVISSAGLPDFPYLAARGNVGLYRCKGTWISGVNPVVGDRGRAPPYPREVVEHLKSTKAMAESLKHLRHMATMLAERSIRKRWPRYSGKRFVLSLVADRLVDARDPRSLAVFFSPGDEERSVEKATLDAFGGVTAPSLKEGLDCDALTSYAGRRNADREWMITASKLKVRVPILADLSFEGVVLLALTDGTVRVKTREELGIPAGVPITVGDDAPCEELKGLSLD
jgi:hypothetical protein